MSEESFYREKINASSRAGRVEMWVGPRNREEIEKALNGAPSTVSVPTGPNINDGTGASFYSRKKGFKTMAEYDTWMKQQAPAAPILLCPYCPEDTKTTYDSRASLQTHYAKCEGYKAKFPNKEKVDKAVESIFACPKPNCKATFSKLEDLEDHERAAHKKVGKHIPKK